MEGIIHQEEAMVACKDQAQIMKCKRTKRHRVPSPLRLVIAMPCATISTSTDVCSSSSELRDSPPSKAEEEDMANYLILLAQGKVSHPDVAVPNSKDGAYLYQCKTCDRVFPSFRALGGHRARHKKMKSSPEHGYNQYCTTTALSLQSASSGLSNLYSAKSSSKLHKCSICGAEFSSGQALGGHMRRHRTLVNASSATTIVTGSSESQDGKKPRSVFKLDLNLPAPDDEDHHDQSDSKFPFHSNKDSVLVFSASPLVDCHY